jgi:DUF2934 family protein
MTRKRKHGEKPAVQGAGQRAVVPRNGTQDTRPAADAPTIRTRPAPGTPALTAAPAPLAKAPGAFVSSALAAPAADAVSVRAHEIWVARGRPTPGTPLEDWLQAERELRAR